MSIKKDKFCSFLYVTFLIDIILYVLFLQDNPLNNRCTSPSMKQYTLPDPTSNTLQHKNSLKQYALPDPTSYTLQHKNKLTKRCTLFTKKAEQRQ